jgi:hypothetical protein
VSVQDASDYFRNRERNTASEPARNEIPAMARLGSTSGAAPVGVAGEFGGGGGPQGLCAKAGELNASTMPSTRVEDFHLAIMGSPSFVNRRRAGEKQRHASHAAWCRNESGRAVSGFQRRTAWFRRRAGDRNECLRHMVSRLTRRVSA